MRISLINSSDWTLLSCDVLAAACPRWSGRPFFLLPQSLDRALLEDDGAEALHVARHHRQRDVAPSEVSLWGVYFPPLIDQANLSKARSALIQA